MKDKNEFLQILRAVLFLMIFAYHCEIPGTSFLWAGVEIFFCISGFFIFNKIFEDIKSTEYLYKIIKNRIKRLWFYDEQVGHFVPHKYPRAQTNISSIYEGEHVLRYLFDKLLLIFI